MISRTVALAAVLAVTASCGEDEPVTVVFVTVDARPAVTGVEQLEVTLRNEAASVSQGFDLDGETFPVTFTVTPTERTGALTVEVLGKDANGILRGEAAASADIVLDDRVDVSVLLEPTDFPINDNIAGSQRLTFNFDASGRQLAANDDGFFVAFVNDCAMLGRCDVLARRFDETGSPTTNATTMDDGELIANLTDEFTAVPSVAATDATVLLAWETTDAIKAVALTSAGGHQAAIETTVSTTTMFVQTAAVAALASGDFIVVWSEAQSDGSDTIRGRLINSGGGPAMNPITGNNLDFEVSAPEIGLASYPHVASTRDGRGFVVVWRFQEDFFGASNVKARFFTASGTPASVGNARITSFTNGDVYGPKVIATDSNRAMVGYSAENPDDPQLADGAVVFARFTSPTGTRDGSPVVQPANLPFSSIVPSMVRRADGTIGATWHQCGNEGDGQGCGIFAQFMRSSGMPVGDPLVVNTTLAGDQDAPSIAALTDSFVIAWSDASRAAPDTDGSGVRGRLIYPDFDINDGRLGAACGGPNDAVCAPSLACVPGNEASPRCHTICDPGDLVQCPRGGACATIGDETACVF